jgi:hypothetical protein
MKFANFLLIANCSWVFIAGEERMHGMMRMMAARCLCVAPVREDRGCCDKKLAVRDCRKTDDSIT